MHRARPGGAGPGHPYRVAFALLQWGSENAPVVNFTAYRIGAVGRPGTPKHPLHLDLQDYLWLCEGIVREQGETSWEQMDQLYATPAPNVPRDLDKRGREIAAFLAATGVD